MKDPAPRSSIESVRQSRTGRRLRRARSTGRAGRKLPESVTRFLRENASGLTFLGITLGVFVSRKFFVLPVAVGAMLAQDRLRHVIDRRVARTGYF